MKDERKVALRILENAISAMGYWRESKLYYADGVDADAVDQELAKISRQIIERYGLNRSFLM